MEFGSNEITVIVQMSSSWRKKTDVWFRNLSYFYSNDKRDKSDNSSSLSFTLRYRHLYILFSTQNFTSSIKSQANYVYFNNSMTIEIKSLISVIIWFYCSSTVYSKFLWNLLQIETTSNKCQSLSQKLCSHKKYRHHHTNIEHWMHETHSFQCFQ